MTKYISRTAAAITAAILLTPAMSAGNNTVEDMSMYIAPAATPDAPQQLTYMPDGSGYALLSDDGRSIDVFDIRSGQKTSTLFSVDNARESKLQSISGFKLSPDASKIIVWTDVCPIYRRSYTARHYVYERRTRLLKPISDTFDHTRIPQFSPDSRMVAFVADNNIYIRKLDYGSQVAVTTDGAKDHIINGATDWTYEEEFTLTSTLAWAPDNTTLCYIRFDESQVPLYSFPMYEGTCEPRDNYALYPGSFTYKYPVAGQPNSKVSLHSYDIETRKVKDIPLPDSRIEYIPRIDYGPTAQQLLVSTLNRDQNHFEIYSVNPKSTVCRSVYATDSKAWILPETYEKLTLDDAGFTVMVPGTSGHIELKQYSYAGASTGTIAAEGHDITAYYGKDAAGNHYYQVTSPTPMDRTVYRSGAKKTPSLLSSSDGTTSMSFSPDMKYAVSSHSDVNTPPVYDLISADGKRVRTLVDNSAYSSRIKPLSAATEFVKIPADGIELNAFIIKPRNFDASRHYPAIMYQYSGPGSQSVLNRWSFNWMSYFADQGFVIICADGRGTAGRGISFMQSVYKNLGHYETIDQIYAARYAASLPYIDSKRIGIFGWSYGGYEALMAASATNSPYAAAVAVAPVTDWRYYDTVYAERYMLTPQQNDEGYNSSAPIKHTASMKMPLLIMHGTADDNVHLLNTYQYVSTLQSQGSMCDMFIFPNMNHSINHCGAQALVYARMLEFFKNKLGR